MCGDGCSPKARGVPSYTTARGAAIGIMLLGSLLAEKLDTQAFSGSRRAEIDPQLYIMFLVLLIGLSSDACMQSARADNFTRYFPFAARLHRSSL